MQDLKQRIANYEEIYETVQARKLIAGTWGCVLEKEKSRTSRGIWNVPLPLRSFWNSLKFHVSVFFLRLTDQQWQDFRWYGDATIWTKADHVSMGWLVDYCRWWFQTFCYVHPYFWKFPILTIISFNWVGEKPPNQMFMAYHGMSFTWHFHHHCRRTPKDHSSNCSISPAKRLASAEPMICQNHVCQSRSTLTYWG